MRNEGDGSRKLNFCRLPLFSASSTEIEMFAPNSVKPNELPYFVDDSAAKPAQISIKTG
jgi:hypothetical protein